MTSTFVPGNLSAAKIADDHLDFSYMRVASEVLDIISKPLFDKNSAILLNAGLHYLESTNFSNYQKTVDSLIRLFDETRMVRRANGKSLFPGEMIWRTTTALNKQKLDAKHIQARRFLTYEVCRIFCAVTFNRGTQWGNHKLVGRDCLDVHAQTFLYISLVIVDKF